MSKVGNSLTTSATVPDEAAAYKTVAPPAGQDAATPDDLALARLAESALSTRSRLSRLLHLYSDHPKFPQGVDAEESKLHTREDRLWRKAWRLRPATATGRRALATLALLHTPMDDEGNIRGDHPPEVWLGQWLALSILDDAAIERVFAARDGRLNGDTIMAALPEPLAVDPATQVPDEVADDPAPGRLPEPPADLRTREAIMAARAENEPILRAALARQRVLWAALAALPKAERQRLADEAGAAVKLAA